MNTIKTKALFEQIIIKNQQVMNDYNKAKDISTDLKLNKQITITPESASNFRRYLSLVAMKANRKYVTKLLNGNVLVIRVR